MKKRLLAILIILCMALAIMPISAAQENGKAIRPGTAGIGGYDETSGYNYIYYGTWNGSPMKWRVLDSQTNMGTPGLFLLSEELLGSGNTGGIKFGYDDEDTWQGSKVQAWCRDFAGIEGDSVPDAFTAAELAAILETSKSDPEYFTPTEKVVIDGGEWTLLGAHFLEVKNALDGDKVFFLSAAEAKNATYGLADVEARAGKYNGKKAYWWLRSPAVDRYVGYVDYLGYVYPMLRGDPHAARPAFNLDSGSVLFASAAVGGKPGGFGAVGTYSRSEWKLTVKDSARDGFSVARKSVFAGSVTFDYKNAKTGENEYISAMVTNGGEIKYYGRLKNVSSDGTENGTLTVSLPSDYNEESGDRLFIFNEQCNGDYNTDYASSPLRLSTDDTGASLVQIRINSVTGEWEVSYDDGATWTSLGVKAAGDKGEKGDKGDTGATGAQGEKGETGATGAQGEKGDKGDTGAQGEKGEKGDAGITPKLKIDESGIWCVSYDEGATWTSLGVKATGEKGEKGDKGDTGATGAQGEKGEKGDAGAQGEKGDTGATGAQGEKGEKGDKGDKGDTGASGSKGAKGDKGETGATGATGATGEKGDKGDAGVAGRDGKDGADGINGADGKDGINGKDGADGKDANSALVITVAVIAILALAGNVALTIYIIKTRKPGRV